MNRDVYFQSKIVEDMSVVSVSFIKTVEFMTCQIDDMIFINHYQTQFEIL